MTIIIFYKKKKNKQFFHEPNTSNGSLNIPQPSGGYGTIPSLVLLLFKLHLAQLSKSVVCGIHFTGVASVFAEIK